MALPDQRDALAVDVARIAQMLALPSTAIIRLLRQRANTIELGAEVESVGNGPAEPPSAAGMKASSEATEVPEWPGELLPSPVRLVTAYREALNDVYHRRGTMPPPGGYALKVQEQAFRAFYSALADSCSTIVSENHPDGHWATDHPPRRDIQVLASAPGSGKSTLAKAFAVALTRVAIAEPFPLGCVFLVHHVATAEAVFQELHNLLPPDSVAVFTTKHDASQPFPEYSNTFLVSDLARHPVIVVTHEFYMGLRGEQARHCTRNGLTFPRVVTFVDERANEIAIYDVDPRALENVVAFVQRDYKGSPELLEALMALVEFKGHKRFGQQGIETPAHDRAGWQAAAAATSYLRSDEAARYARSAAARMPALEFDAVFGFANAMAEDRAFISRGNRGVVNFVGYERALPRASGMVLLDATADIDGISKICRWRKHAELPQERYDSLHIVHVPSVATGNLRQWLSERHNLYTYVAHIQDLVRRHVPFGGKALVVCTKALAVAEDILGWSEHVKRFLNRTDPKDPYGTFSDDEFTEERAWSLDGRLVAVTWFGGYGIGANLWREADVVIVCDDYYLPQRVVKATLQGLKGHKATEGLLANADNHWSDELSYLHDGHILRWMKQMALRGKGREMSEHGNCGHQKLVITGDLLRLLSHRPKVFPGAKITATPNTSGQWLEKLAVLLLSPDLPQQVSTKSIGQKLGADWGDISSPSSTVRAGQREISH
jgi:hypothetical protein